jgi:hypothetical protein
MSLHEGAHAWQRRPGRRRPLLPLVARVHAEHIESALTTRTRAHTQVEESFHLQATHDVLVHGRDLASYDHAAFPGVVPRTFLGALALAASSLPAAAAVSVLGLPKIYLQLAVRLTLAGIVVTSFVRMKWAVAARFGGPSASAMVLLACASPHLLFYAGRTLPNVFALYLVCHAVAEWLRLQVQPDLPGPLFGMAWGYMRPPLRLILAVSYFVAAVLIFRCDMLVLLIPVALSWLLCGKASVAQLAVIGGSVGVAVLALSVGVDSVFWGRWLWPEGEVLAFNALANRSHEYGVSPAHWYFTSALPRAMLGALAFLPLGFLRLRGGTARNGTPSLSAVTLDTEVLEFVGPALAFVSLYSALPHKETRFLLPALPLLFLAAGRGLVNVTRVGMWLLWGPRVVEAAAEEEQAHDEASSGEGAREASGLRQRRVKAEPASPSHFTPPVNPALRRRIGSSAGASLDTLSAPRAAPGSLPSRALGVLILGGVVVLFVASVAATGLFVRVSMDNYPGGVALQRVYTLYARDLRRAAKIGRRGADLILWSLEGRGEVLPFCPEGDVTSASSAVEWGRQCISGACPPGLPWSIPGGSAGPPVLAAARPCVTSLDDAHLRPIRIHIDVAAAEAGVSRFGEAWHAGRSFVFSKAEGLVAGANATMPDDFEGFDLLLTEDPAQHASRFIVVGREAIQGFAGLGVDWKRGRLTVRTAPRIYIMQRKPDQFKFRPVAAGGGA